MDKLPFLRAAAGAGLALLLCSCASSDRMVRISPFSEKGKPSSLNYDSDRVNLWPMFYKDGQVMSVVWPVVDSDPKGFAVRPFYNHEGNEYSILFPYCAWNPVEDVGWAAPVYWRRKNFGVFPVLHKSEDHVSWAGPVYWSQWGYGFFPVFNHENNDISWAGPAYWSKWGYGFFPVFHKGNRISWVGPAYWSDRGFGCFSVFHYGHEFSWTSLAYFSEELNFAGPLWMNLKDSSGGVFPVYMQEGNSGWLFPLYNYRTSPSSVDFFMMFGALGMWTDSSVTKDFHYRFVNAFYTGGEHSAHSGFIPLWYYQRKNKDSLIVTPLAGYGWNSDSGEPYFENILGPVYIHAARNNFRSVMFPLYFQSGTKSDSDIAALPFFWWGNRGSGNFLDILGPVYYYKSRKIPDSPKSYSEHNFLWPSTCFNMENGETRDWYSWPLVSYKAGIPSILMFDKNLFSFMGPLGYMERRKPASQPDNEYGGRCDRYFLAVFSTESLSGAKYLPVSQCDGFDVRCSVINESIFRYLFFFKSGSADYRVWKKGCDHESLMKLLSATKDLALQCRQGNNGNNEKRTRELEDKRKKVVELSAKTGISVPETPDEKSGKELQDRLINEYCDTIPYLRFNFPLLFDYKGLEDDYKWDVLFWLADGERTKDKSRASVMKYFYRRESEGDTVKGMLFPFVTWKSAPGRSNFSFMWRVFDISQEEGKTSGHIMFIPW
jgi:hypothetical protein